MSALPPSLKSNASSSLSPPSRSLPPPAAPRPGAAALSRRARAALSRASRRAVMAAAVALGASFLVPLPAQAAAVGQAAPDFVARDTRGGTHRLSDLRGRYVVLEWTNPGCPFVRKHYGSGNLPATQQSAVERGAVWLAIDSTARDSIDYLQPAALDAWMREHRAAASAVLMDEDGVIGRAYGARTTPHLFIIDPQGTLVYAGGIDSIASARAQDIPRATNYVGQALEQAFGGRAITAATTAPYGSTVKYKI